ncbi:MAG: hypothetical protein ACRCSN_02375 [Dermatophilaceae bacterium]
MTAIRVDAEGVAELGASLVEIAESLVLMGDSSQDGWALGTGEARGALEELLGGWRRVRLQLGEGLAGLGEAAAAAGGLYLDTEAGVSRGLVGGSSW